MLLCLLALSQSDSAHEYFMRAQEAMRGRRFVEAHHHLTSAVASKTFKRELSAEHRFMIHANLAMMLTRDLPGAPRDDEAEVALRSALALKPTSAHMQAELGLVHVRRQNFESAAQLLTEAMRIQPAESAAAYEQLHLWQVEAARQMTYDEGKQDARRAWQEAVALGREFAETLLGSSVRRWRELAAAPSAEPLACTVPTPQRWDAGATTPCTHIWRAKGESLEAATRRGLAERRDGSGAAERGSSVVVEPAIVRGMSPEFPESRAFWSALSRCAELDEGGTMPAVVEAIVTHPDGSVVQLQPASEWAAVDAVASQLAHGEANVAVRGAQEYMLLADLLQMTGRTPQPLYLANGNLDVYLPCMRSAVDAPPRLREAIWGGTNRSLLEVNVWLGVGGGTTSGRHYDAHHNWHHVIAGEKDVLLFPPASDPSTSEEEQEDDGTQSGVVEVKVPLSDEGLRNMRGKEAPSTGRVSARRVQHFASSPDDGHSGSTSRQVGECANRAMRCHVRAGETLFIPAGWEHNVLTTASRSDECRSAGINLWYSAS